MGGSTAQPAKMQYYLGKVFEKDFLFEKDGKMQKTKLTPCHKIIDVDGEEIDMRTCSY